MMEVESDRSDELELSDDGDEMDIYGILPRGAVLGEPAPGV